MTKKALDSETGGRMAAYRASDGKRLWDVDAQYGSRPIINDRTIYAQPGAWDLLTGEQTGLRFSRSYGCGTLAGSTNLLLYRSATLGYTDLSKGGEVQNYGGIRPGCWINAIARRSWRRASIFPNRKTAAISKPDIAPTIAPVAC